MADTQHVRPLRPPEKVRLIGEILATYPSAWRLVRSNDLETMVARARTVRHPRPHRVGPELEHSFATQVGVAVTRTLHVLPTDKRCLIRSIVLTKLLSRRAIPSRLVIGVTPGADFVAHAWVEHDQQPVLPPGMHTRLHEL